MHSLMQSTNINTSILHYNLCSISLCRPSFVFPDIHYIINNAHIHINKTNKQATNKLTSLTLQRT